MFRKIRITILLLILLSVALSAWRTQEKAQEWKSGQYIYVFPIGNGLQGDTSRYIQSLNTESWRQIEQFFTREGEIHQLKLTTPIRLRAGPAIPIAPPVLSVPASKLGAMWWSLQLRWWVWRYTPETQVKPDACIYLIYHPPVNGVALPHSLGIAKARLGVANLFASDAMHGSNQVVIAHELLHIYGANDHYDLSSNQPLFPQGYAEPDLQPRFPQNKAEIMGGRIPINENQSLIPSSLSDVVLGVETAKSIGWLK